MSRKAQVGVVGFTIVTLILLISVSASFVWGRGLIEKSTSMNDLSRVENQMISLHTAIKEVANEHSQRSVDFTIKDGWLLVPNNDTIRYESFADLPDSVRFNDKRIVVGNTSAGGPCLSSSTNLGHLGYDDPGCLIQKGGAIFELNYIILNDTSENECFGILLNSGGNLVATKGDHKVLLTFNNTRDGSSSDCASVAYSVISMDID